MNENVNTKSSKTNYFLIGILLLLFLFTLFITLRYIDSYYRIEAKGDEEIITVHTESSTATIMNDGKIHERITNESFDEKGEYVVEKINSIVLEPQEKNKNIIIKYNVRYNIVSNNFNLNASPTNNSNVLVKFSYSLDKENWKYINNVITTSSSNISPLVGNTYDVAGIVTNLDIATNNEISAKNSKHVIYWRSETIFKKNENFTDNDFIANFSIEYGDNK